MKTAKSEENIHPNAPRRLVSAWRKAGYSDRKLAKLRDVNHFYVSQLLWRGIEPNNKTIRVKLYLPASERKPRVPKPEEFPGQKKIMKIIRIMRARTTRNVLKRWRNNNGKC